MKVTVPPPGEVLRHSARVGLAVWDQTLVFYTSLLRSPQESEDLNEIYVEYEGKKIEFEATSLNPAEDATVYFTPPYIEGPRPWGLVEVAVGITPNGSSVLPAGVYTVDIVNATDGVGIQEGFQITYSG